MPPSSDLVVLGGGVMGRFTAYHAAEQGARDAALPHLGNGPVDKPAHSGVPREVIPDVLFGLAARNSQLRRQTKRADAVHDSKVHRLGVAARLRRHHERRHAQHLRRRARMNVLSIGEGFHQQLIA